VELSEFLALTSDLAKNHADQAKVTEILTKLNDDYTTESTNKAALSTFKETAEKDIAKLKEQNMNLFLRTGQPVESKKLNDPEPMTFEDLLTKEFGVSE
jgi:hypothetical protein